jgi:hypothetical protein
VAGALRFAEAPERWLLGYRGRQKNLNRRAIEESLFRLTIGLPLESEAKATRGFRKAERPCHPRQDFILAHYDGRGQDEGLILKLREILAELAGLAQCGKGGERS